METAKNEKIQEIRDIKYTDINTNQQFRDWIGTQKEYDNTTLKTPETRYNIYDDTTGDTILKFFRGKHPTSYYDPKIVRVIQADNGKLTSWDKVGDMPIKREGNKPLDDYIIASGDWGTIYSDGTVTVEQLAPTTNSDYQIALSQLEEIQASGISLLNEEGYTPFDFNSLTDHETLINDINNANVKKIDSTVYPITYTDSTTGETVSVDKPILKQGTILTPISFGCLVTSDNRIYTGIGYENIATVDNSFEGNEIKNYFDVDILKNGWIFKPKEYSNSKSFSIWKDDNGLKQNTKYTISCDIEYIQSDNENHPLGLLFYFWEDTSLNINEFTDIGTKKHVVHTFETKEKK